MLRTITVAVPLVFVCYAAKLEVDLVPQTSIMKRLDAGLVSQRQRQQEIRNLFEEVGCSVEEQQVDKKHANVFCTLPGQTTSTIVVGGHFDFVERGEGIVDDWSGTSLLPSLFQALKIVPRRHTYVFVAFTEEERGLIGSSYYVKKLTNEQKPLIRAFVNLECLGLTSAKVWIHRSTPALVVRLGEVARAVDLPLQGVNVEQVGDDDTHPFLSAKIPVITIHSVTQETLPVLHTDRDRKEAIHPDEYYDTYKLLAFYLAYLDVKTE
jgi:Zn-dependent M28 family amino/carboxypeptidase